jgi:hypothetical protein
MNWYGMPVFSRLTIIFSFLVCAGHLIYRAAENHIAGTGDDAVLVVGVCFFVFVAIFWAILPEFFESIFRREDE